MMPMEPTYLGSIAVWRHAAKSSVPVARLLLIHGISEHSGRHANTVEHLTANGLEVVRFDLRGAGRSGGRRQWVARFEDYADDTARVLNWISQELPSSPLYVLGHSLGGAVAIYFTAKYQRMLRGLILSAPAYKVGGSIPQWKLTLGKAISPLLPRLKMPGSRDKSWLARDPSVGSEFLADPLTCQFNTLQQGSEVLRALPHLPGLCREITLPVVIFHGSGDQIIRVEGSFDLLRNFSSRDRILHVFPGGYHELHNDLDKIEYLNLLSAWLNKH